MNGAEGDFIKNCQHINVPIKAPENYANRYNKALDKLILSCFFTMCAITIAGFNIAPVILPHQQNDTNIPTIARKVYLSYRNPNDVRVVTEKSIIPVN